MACAGNHMRARQLPQNHILRAMPGPWGKAIEKLRVERRLKRETVAKRARMTPTTYGRIEKGRHTLTSKLQDIADVFGVPIEEVLGDANSVSRAGYGLATHSSASPGVVPHVPGVGVSAPTTTELHELQAQVTLLQQELASVVAEQEARRRQRGERVSTPRARKSGRAAHARKTRS